MKAAVLEDFGSLKINDIPRPELTEPDQAILRVIACGVCGSDLSIFKGTLGMRARWTPPLFMGHELVGVVEQGPAQLLGQTVAVNPIVACDECRQCRAGLHNLCINRKNIGLSFPGGFAEQIKVPQSQLYILPEATPAWKGALVEPLAVALRAVELAGVLAERKTLVIGGGAIGILAAWLAGRSGARIQIVEQSAVRRAWLSRFGFEALVEPQGDYEVALDAVGSSSTLELAVQSVLPGSTIVMVGLQEQTVNLPLYPLVLWEKKLLGSYCFSEENFRRAAGLVQSIPNEFAVQRPLQEAPAVFAELLKGGMETPKIVLLPSL